MSRSPSRRSPRVRPGCSTGVGGHDPRGGCRGAAPLREPGQPAAAHGLEPEGTDRRPCNQAQQDQHDRPSQPAPTGPARQDRRHRQRQADPEHDEPADRATGGSTGADEGAHPGRDGRAGQPGVERVGRPGRDVVLVGRPGHTVTTGRRSASVASPIPDTSPSSSTELNRPCAVRQSRMRWASTGPIPGSASRASSVAEFRSTGADGGRRRARAAHRSSRAGRRDQRRAPPPLHHELLAVDEQPGQVHARGSRRRSGATRGPHRVDHPRAGREAHQAGVVHGSDDVHHHLRSRAGRRRGRAGGRRGRHPGSRRAHRQVAVHRGRRLGRGLGPPDEQQRHEDGDGQHGRDTEHRTSRRGPADRGPRLCRRQSSRCRVPVAAAPSPAPSRSRLRRRRPARPGRAEPGEQGRRRAVGRLRPAVPGRSRAHPSTLGSADRRAGPSGPTCGRPRQRPPAVDDRRTSARRDHDREHPRPDVGSDDGADLADVQVRPARAPARAAGRPARSARSGLARWCTARSTGPLPARPTATSSRRAIALAEVRTFSSASMWPSTICSSGFIARAEPSRAAAAPIRPPRRRCSRVST